MAWPCWCRRFEVTFSSSPTTILRPSTSSLSYWDIQSLLATTFQQTHRCRARRPPSHRRIWYLNWGGEAKRGALRGSSARGRVNADIYHVTANSSRCRPSPPVRGATTKILDFGHHPSCSLSRGSVSRLLGLCRVTRLTRVLDSKLESSNFLLLEYSHRIFSKNEISK